MIFNPIVSHVGGAVPVIEPLFVAQNGTTIAPAGTDGYNPVTVNVPDTLQYVTNFDSAFSTANCPLTTISIKNNLAYNYSQCFYQNTTVTSIALDIKTDGLYLQGLCRGASNVQTVTFVNPILTATNFYDIFHTCSNLETVTWDWRAALTGNVTDMFRNCAKLKNITFGKSVIGNSLLLNASPLLSTASLISIANGLDENVSGKTLTLHATPKAACDTIYGNIVDGVFVEAATGTSLTSFITTTKGWTLA